MQYHYHYHKVLPLTSFGIVRDIKCYHTSLTGIPILCNVKIALNRKAYALKTLTSVSYRLVINVLSFCPVVLIRLGTTKKGIGPTYASKVCTSSSYHRNFCIYSLVFSLYFSVISFFFYYPFQAQRIGLRICDLVGDFNVFEQKWVNYVL